MLDQPRPTAENLGSRLEFETLIADTSASLFAVPPDELERTVQRALERVRVFFQADRCALLSVRADQQAVEVRLASYGEGVSAVPTGVNLLPLFPWARQIVLVERVAYRVSKLEDLPSEADADREALIGMQARSALLLPVETDGRLGHLIALQAVHEEREWPDVFVTRLRVLGQMLAGALERQTMVADLLEAETRVSLAADSAEAGLWTLDFGTGTFWATPLARAIFGYRPTRPSTWCCFRHRSMPTTGRSSGTPSTGLHKRANRSTWNTGSSVPETAGCGGSPHVGGRCPRPPRSRHT